MKKEAAGQTKTVKKEEAPKTQPKTAQTGKTAQATGKTVQAAGKSVATQGKAAAPAQQKGKTSKK